MNLNTEIRIPPKLKKAGKILGVIIGIGYGLLIVWELVREFGWVILGIIFQAIDRLTALPAADIHFYILLVIVWLILGKLIRVQSELSALRRDIQRMRDDQEAKL